METGYAVVSKEIMKQTETILVYAGFMHDLEDFFNVFLFPHNDSPPLKL